ncbi:hypothetical protein ACFX2I_002529 [Malus domestica]
MFKCLKHIAGGDVEFWADVTIIARIHHLNLVRFLGFCAEKGQRILVYEYVPNGSLDKYLFQPGRVTPGVLIDDEQKPILDWGIRYRIALGVARSIAYLHEDLQVMPAHLQQSGENLLPHPSITESIPFLKSSNAFKSLGLHVRFWELKTRAWKQNPITKMKTQKSWTPILQKQTL